MINRLSNNLVRHSNSHSYFSNFYRFSSSIADPKDKLEYFNDIKTAWKEIVAQKLVLVCFKAGSYEIVGMHFVYVLNKKDNFMEAFFNLVYEKLILILKKLFSYLFYRVKVELPK